MRDHTTAAWVPIITVIGYNFGYSLTGAILIEVLSEKLAHQPQRRPAVAATRAQDAAVQIGSIRPALPQHACRGPQHLQSSTPSRLAINAADLSSRSGERMAECGDGSVIAHPASGLPDRDKLT